MPSVTIDLRYALVNEMQSGLYLRACWSLLLDKSIVPKSSGKFAGKASLVAEIKRLMISLQEDSDLYKKLFDQSEGLIENNHTIEYSC